MASSRVVLALAFALALVASVLAQGPIASPMLAPTMPPVAEPTMAPTIPPVAPPTSTPASPKTAPVMSPQAAPPTSSIATPPAGMAPSEAPTGDSPPSGAFVHGAGVFGTVLALLSGLAVLA